MPVLVTIMNIGDRPETIDGNVLAINDTLVVDITDPVIQAELSHDMDYAILPDSAAGTVSSGYVATFLHPGVNIVVNGAGANHEDGIATGTAVLEIEGDGEKDTLVFIHIPTLLFSDITGGVNVALSLRTSPTDFVASGYLIGTQQDQSTALIGHVPPFVGTLEVELYIAVPVLSTLQINNDGPTSGVRIVAVRA